MPRSRHTPIGSDLKTSELPAAHGGYFAKPQRDLVIDYDKEYTLEELKVLGFKYIAWDGITPIPIYDEDGRIFAVLAGCPDDPSYLKDADDAFETMASLGEQEEQLVISLSKKGWTTSYSLSARRG
ncbi:hypothetical protein BDZ89DRAFT_1141062 [Hymenopellis radicata]|nr:hypothetical protein BDZ89DRAFT_1141062 [Hymenopellis radicata]